jgi:hypothetical protein
MGSISRLVPAFAAVCLILTPVLYAQNAGVPPGIPMGSELQNIEKILASPGISASERYDALVRLALLRQLAGDAESAAASWLEAASSANRAGLEPDSGDTALIAGAFCLASMGEWERAAAALVPPLASGRQGPVIRQARYLDACLKAWASGDLSPLGKLAGNPEYAELRPAIYYTLWKTADGNPGLAGGPAGDGETWKTRLLLEFPQSPEGRIAASENGGGLISAKPSPLWLLLPGGLGTETTFSPARPRNAEDTSAVKLLQTGLFSGEANARAQAERLTSAGFSPSLIQRNVNGAVYWAVTVPAGEDTSRTIRELKNAGFESFPLSTP